jgi:tight adherence protein B
MLGGFGLGLTLLLSILIATWPSIHLYKVIEQRHKKFEEQLPDALDYIARALRAGYSLTMAIHSAAEELEEPVGYELKVTSDQINFGLPFNEALNNLSLRVNSADLNFFVIALNIQRDTGGNLTELLANLAKIIRERIKLSGKVRILSSEGRFSALILFLFPFIMAFILNLVNPKYMSMLWTTPVGNNMVLVGIVIMLLGGFWTSRIVKIKV